MQKRLMNEELKKYPVYGIIKESGMLYKLENIKSTSDYNHSTHHIHHYIKDYERNKKWYDERGIKQKLFLIPITLHEQIHQTAIYSLPDVEFKEKYKISRWDLVFNRRHSEY